MSTKDYLYKMQDKVKAILAGVPSAREDDCVLFAEYIFRYNRELANDGIVYSFVHHKELGLPSYESITRARRKIQAEDESLRPENDKRLDLVEEYSEWAVNR